MEWLDRMKSALDYLEQHMEGPLEIEGAAKAALSSPFHFQRMFHMLTGVTVAEYVRRRKLTLAAQELAASDTRVLDVALKYGYSTPESFSKAFQRLHGVSPSAARQVGMSLRAYPRISFHISLKGDKDMEYKIEEKAGYRVVGKALRVSNRDGENTRRIPEFWQECNQTGVSDQIAQLNPTAPLLGVCMEYSSEQDQWTYLIAVETKDAPVPEGMVEKHIPAATWAVFESVGPMPNAIQEVWNRIFSEWVPATGYEIADAPQLEVYPPGSGNSEDYRCEVHIPIVKE